MEFNPCFFCSSSIYPSTPDGAGASSSLNDNAKIRNLKTPLHTFSYFLILAHTFSHFLILSHTWKPMVRRENR